MGEAAIPASDNDARIAGLGTSPPAPRPDFMTRQVAFAAHLRDPEHCPAPADLDERRMGLYRALIFNNVDSLLAGNFPVLHGLLPKDRWQALVRDFLTRHRARSPLFPELPQEFLDYLAKERGERPEDPPFLLELAHYEWVELALLIAEDGPDLAGIDANGDLLAGCPLVSPLAWSLVYRYPVHRIGPGHEPQAPPAEPTRLLVFRNRTDQVEFLEINAVTQRLIELLREVPDRTGEAALARIAAELVHPNSAQVLTHGAQLLQELHACGVFLGTRRAAGPPSLA
jgi:uncharacterized protein